MGRLTDAFVPHDPSVPAEQLGKLRSAVWILLLGVVFISAAAIYGLLTVQHPGYVPKHALASVAFVLLLVGCRNGLPVEVIGHGLAAVLYAVTIAELIVEPQLHPSSCMALLATPVAVVWLAGGRAGLLWSGLSTALLLGASWKHVGSSDQALLLSSAVTSMGLTGVAHAFDSQRRRTTQELMGARDEAEAGAVAKSRFLANMSHEIRTPLNGVLGMLGLLLDGPLPKEQRAFARTAHQSGTALLDLLNDILDFSKLEAGHMVLEATPFDLRTLVEDVLDQVAISAQDKELELVCRYAPRTPSRVTGDPGRVRQILLNLISNAVKFTPRGHVLVTVEHQPHGDEGRYRFSVEDTGIGIPQQEHESIFEEFQQVDDTNTRAHAGTGLGLAIVRDLVTLMGGQLGLRSAVDEGSTFWFTLPLTPAGPASAEPHLRFGHGLLGARVLVVDDHPVNRWVLRELLTRWRFAPSECASGDEALALLRDARAKGLPFPIVISDHQMPGMDGLQLARQIKDDPKLADTVLVLLSSSANLKDAREVQEAGYSAYLAKPVHRSELLDALVRAWSSAQEEGRLFAAGIDVRVSPEPESDLRLDLRILVVEDNSINQRVARGMLVALGCRVDVAGDGEEALQLIDTIRYDLVFMDVQMPRRDGFETTREIRRRELGGDLHLPIVAMTAHAMPDDRERCAQAGMDGYVSKPMRRQDLVRAIRAHAPGGIRQDEP
ncbi:MAG: response regulator [Myxococcales bacterium]|nr:response regulator [Myxococcales bacterium]MCB9712415.1 response regulator [Myxococcales bacterium]